jgi:outer membrane protein assembly factor BamB
MSFRFDVSPKGTKVMFLDIPELKFHDLGPIAIKPDGDNFKGSGFELRVTADKAISGSWSFDGNDLTFDLQPGQLTDSPAAKPLEGRTAKPLWTFKTAGAIWSSPVLADNVVYFGSDDGNLYSVFANSGKQVWQFKTNGKIMGRPTIDGSFVYALSDDGFLYKLDRRNAKLVWKVNTNGGAMKREVPGPKSEAYDYLSSAATVSNGTVYIGSADKKLYAIDAASGQQKWQFETNGMVRSTPAVSNGKVFFGSYDHYAYAVDAATGSLSWKVDTKREVVSSPLVIDGTVYLGSRCSDLFALDAVTGNVKWKYFYWSSWVESSASFRDNTIYIGSSDAQQLFALDAVTGRRRWNINLDGSVWSSPAVTEKNVYVGVAGVPGYFVEHHGGFFAVDRQTGKIAWRFPMNKIPNSYTYGVASSPAVDRGNVYFGGLDGTFYAFRAAG